MTITMPRRKRKNTPTLVEPDGVDPTTVRPGRLALEAGGAHAHLIATNEGVWAFFILNPVAWHYTAPEDRLRKIVSFAQSTAELKGHRIRVQTTSSPWQGKAYAEAMAADCGDRHIPDSDTPGARTFEEFVAVPQVYAAEEGRRKPVTVVGVRITTAKASRGDLPLLLSTTPLEENRASWEPVRTKLLTVTNTVAREGMNAVPMTAAQMKWLIHSSIGMGTPTPSLHGKSSEEAWDENEVLGFTNGVYATANPGAGHTTIRALRDGHSYTSYVSVVHADTIEDRDPVGAKSAWIARMQQFPFHVDTLAVFDVIPAEKLLAEMQGNVIRTKSIADQNKDHGLDASGKQNRAINNAQKTLDEAENGTDELSTRVRGVFLVAVTAPDLSTLENKRFDDLLKESQRNGIGLTRGLGQYALYRAFVPGEPVPMEGHTVQMSTMMFATSMPHINVSGGDKKGLVLGPIAGGHDLFTFNPWGGASRNKSNMIVGVSGLGGGKSTLIGMLADYCASVAGARTIVNDPSGPLAALVDLPHLRGSSRLVNLGSAQPGTLSPSVMVVDPVRADYNDPEFSTDENDQKYRLDLATARQERVENTINVLTMLFPPRMMERSGDTVEALLTEAVIERAGHYGADTWEVVAWMEQSKHELAGTIATHLTQAAEQRIGRQLFSERGTGLNVDYIDRLTDNLLTVVTMKGLELPPKGSTNPADWSPSARASLPALSQTEGFARRVMYSDKSRKAILSDELGILTAGQSQSASALTRGASDSRKWNALYGLFTQTPQTLLDISPDIEALAGTIFLGKMDGAPAKKAIAMARLPEGHGYEQKLTSAEPGDFLVRDWNGNVQQVGVDKALLHPHLDAALDTTPEHAEDDSYDPIGG